MPAFSAMVSGEFGGSVVVKSEVRSTEVVVDIAILWRLLIIGP